MNSIQSIRMNCENSNLKKLDEDVLYHLGLSTKTVDFKEHFGDVKFVCTGGSAHRIKDFAHQLAKKAGIHTELPNLASKGGRFVLYKVGGVLCANHGMGTPSLSILLHELFKLLHYAECTNVTFIRLGTSGGLGVQPGTLVITTEALNTEFKPFYELHILGKTVNRPSYMDQTLVEELYSLAKSLPENTPIIKGKTVCANDFYEEQARLDGAFCSYSEQEKLAYLREAHKLGVRNFEMECTCFAAQCRMAGIRAAVVCVTLVDRLSGDQVNHTPDDYDRMQQLPGKLVTLFLQKHNALYNSSSDGSATS